MPRLPSKMQLLMVMFLKPPLDSVPHLMRPFLKVLPSFTSGVNCLNVPSSMEPSS